MNKHIFLKMPRHKCVAIQTYQQHIMSSNILRQCFGMRITFLTSTFTLVAHPMHFRPNKEEAMIIQSKQNWMINPVFSTVALICFPSFRFVSFHHFIASILYSARSLSLYLVPFPSIFHSRRKCVLDDFLFILYTG